MSNQSIAMKDLLIKIMHLFKTSVPEICDKYDLKANDSLSIHEIQDDLIFKTMCEFMHNLMHYTETKVTDESLEEIKKYMIDRICDTKNCIHDPRKH